MAQNCPHCGSKYTEKRGTDETFSEKKHNFRCLSCKKDFSVRESKRSAKGSWLMTFYDRSGDIDYSDRIELYRDSSGNISINQKKGSKYISGAVKFRIYADNGYRHIWVDTKQRRDDPNGDLLITCYVKMNEKLTEKALQNEAMRIAYRPRGYFYLEDLTDELRNDIAAYLRSVTGALDEDPISKAFSNGCYVATAVYGSYDCPQVWTLRRFRDNTLASTWYGRAFIRTYYAISPTLVKWFGHTAWFKNMWRGKLDKLVDTLQKQGVESTPYQDKNW